MKTLSVLLLTVAFSTFFVRAAAPLPADPPRLLVFSKTAGWRHDSIPVAVEALRKAGQEKGFTITHSEDGASFTPENLKMFQSVVFLLTTGDVLNDTQQSAFESYIAAGGGYVGIHSATDTECGGKGKAAWPWYIKLSGACFTAHPSWPSNVQAGRVSKTDIAHASTATLPDQFTREDEWYDFDRVNPNVKVILTLDESSYKGATMGAGQNHPVSWFHESLGGRAFYTSMGHTKESFADPIFMDHLLTGIAYTLGDK